MEESSIFELSMHSSMILGFDLCIPARFDSIRSVAHACARGQEKKKRTESKPQQSAVRHGA